MTGSNQSSTYGSSSSTSDVTSVRYDTPAIQVGNAVRDGDEFVLMVKSRQSDEIQLWSSGDRSQTQGLFKEARSKIDQLTPA